MCFCFVLFVLSARTQDIPELNFVPDVDFLKMPEGWYLQEVSGVAVDADDHLFVLHRGKHPLLEFDAQGNFLRSIAEDLLVRPHGLRIDRFGNIWTTDVATHVVLKLDPSGQLKMVLGKKNLAGEEFNGYGLFAHLFDRPTDVAFDSQDNVYVSDGYGNSRVMKFDRDGAFLKSWGTKGADNGQFDLPHTIVIDANDRVYVGDRQNQRIQVFDTDGSFIEAWEGFGHPYGIAEYDRKFYLAIGTQGRIVELSATGKVTGSFGKVGKKAGQFDWPHMIAADSKGNLYVAEVQNWRVQKLRRGG